jgi:hypothetical protein
MWLSDTRLRCRLFIPLALVYALAADRMLQAAVPLADAHATEGTVKEVVQIRAKGFITFYAIAPDGKTLVYGEALPRAEGKPGHSELVHLDLTTGKELHRRQVDTAPWAVFSPDGKLLAVGTPNRQKAATVWDVVRWEPKVQLKHPAEHAEACPLAFSPDGKLVAGRARRQKPDSFLDEDLILWDVTTGACRILEDPEARRVRHSFAAGFCFVNKDGKESNEPGAIVGRAPMAASFPDLPAADRLFVEYHNPLLTTLWDTARGKALRTDLYSVGELPLDDSQCSLAGRGAPLPGSRADLFRFRLTPSGHTLFLPKYQPPPLIAVPHKDGTIALAVTPIERRFGLSNPWPGLAPAELCRLEDYKDRDPADRGLSGRTCRLSPDGRRLVALGIDPATVKTNNPVSVLRVWDVVALHPLAREKMQQQKLAGAEREQLWSALFEDQPDPATVTPLEFPPARYGLALQAMYSLVLHGDDGVAWLRKKLGPPFDLKQVPRLITDLDSPDFPTRERASLRLEQLGPLARPALEKALQQGPPPEAKRRIEPLLARLRGTEVAYELRQLRLIDVLEHIPTPAARALLQALAEGKYDPAFAEEAKKALQRVRATP